MKIIFDTNILISAAFRGGKPKMAIAHVIASSSFEWIASSEIIKEYKEVLNRPKLKLSQITKQEWLKLIDLSVILIYVNLTIDFPRDRKDAKFLACAISSGADYLITGDKDFEDIPDLGVTKVFSVSQFLEIIND
ncbi:putative toxin-antitoxin system toxin component, PIN family [Geminocystis sp. CENA526]|uniref:putative toxin-antitoxin system toxin component, PIN family n=1 Tax=Geminocystis sp. CENA526 TaxID=1355871 RepID=UPI003D6DFDC4